MEGISPKLDSITAAPKIWFWLPTIREILNLENLKRRCMIPVIEEFCETEWQKNNLAFKWNKKQ